MQQGDLAWYNKIANQIARGNMEQISAQEDMYQLLLNMRSELGFEDDENRALAMKMSVFNHKWAAYMAGQTGDSRYEELYWQSLLLEAPWRFESYLYYVEKNRAPEKKFYRPREKTMKVIAQDLQDLEDRKIEFYGLSLPPRVGKALAFDTPVLTDHGWKKHGELTIMDRVVGADGLFKRILAIHNPCKMEYKVVFSDGEEIVCHGNHEWHVYDRHRQQVVDIETHEMIGKLRDKDEHYRFQVPFVDVENGEEKELPVDPYTLGAWLGDGRNTNPDICGADSDYAIIQKILDNGYEIAWQTKHRTTGVMYYGFKGLRDQLQSCGMCHSRHRSVKHIPDEYFTASVEQRLQLLAGLLDTDGTLGKKDHRYQFTTNEPRLRDDFISLVSTFGWRASVVRYESGYSKTGIHANKPWWVIGFNPTMHIPCQLERKQLFEFSKQRRITIERIEQITDEQYGNCITVEGGLYRAGKTLKITHNSTICLFFMTWIMGKRPDSHNAMSGHSGILADGFYSEAKNIINTQEYTWAEIFPGVKFDKVSAEKKEINLGSPDRFSTLTCRGIDGTWTGAVDISRDGYLYVDDLVRDRTESLSPSRLEGRYQDYLNVLVDRKNDGSRELMVGTRWNVLDPLGRVEQTFRNDPRYRFRKIPALDENNESNFDYKYHKGFSTQYFLDLRAKLDKAEWMAKYQQQPFVREGLLFPEDELRYFDGIIRADEYRVVAACDPAFGGGDSVSMPICVDDGTDIKQVIDWVFTKDSIGKSIPKVVDAVVRYDVSELRIEKNNGGELYAQKVQEELGKRGYNHCKIVCRPAPNKMPKEEKIKAYSDYIKAHFSFLLPNMPSEVDDSEAEMIYKRTAEYDGAIAELSMFTAEGKNPHDDAPDGLTQLAMIFEDKLIQRPTVVINSPF